MTTKGDEDDMGKSTRDDKLTELRAIRNALGDLHPSHHEGAVLKTAVLALLQVIGPDDLNDDLEVDKSGSTAQVPDETETP